jgi:hypothetical protein
MLGSPQDRDAVATARNAALLYPQPYQSEPAEAHNPARAPGDRAVARRRPASPFGEGGSRRLGNRETAPNTTLWNLRRANRRRLRRRVLIQRLIRLGPRTILEFVEELIRHGLVDDTELENRLHGYARLDPELLPRPWRFEFQRSGERRTRI